MAPAPTTLKTYSRKHIPHRRNSSVEVFDALLAENICKRKEAAHTTKTRRRKPIKIKELPPPDENHHLIEDSICRSWGLEDTFDRICKNPVVNNVKPVFMTASNRSTSNSRIILTNSVPSPISHNTRSYKKRLDSSNESSQSNIEVNRKKEKTLDKSVDVSLLIEKVPRFAKPQEISSLSSPSNVKSDGSVPPQMRSITNCNSVEISFEPLFSKTFMDTAGNKMHIASTPAVASSTPCKLTPMINETMSPILNNTQPKSLMESYEEIQKWNYKPPDFEVNALCCDDTPKGKRKKHLQPKKLQKKKEINNQCVNKKVISALFEEKKLPSKIYRAKPDWKLKGEAKVVIDKCLEVIGIEKSIKLGNLDELTLGFLPVKQDVLKNTLEITNIFEESLKNLCSRRNVEFENFDAKSPVRYIALRKRKVPIVHTKTKPKTEKTDLELRTRKQSKSSTNSRELHVNSKPTCSKRRKRIDSSRSSCSVSQDTNDEQNSSEISATPKSTFSDPQESICSSVSKINESSRTNSQESSSINQELSNKIFTKLSPSDSKIVKDVTDISANNEMSANDDFNKPCSISLHSPIEFEVVNSHELVNILEESQEAAADNITTSSDVIPSTPETKLKIRHRVNSKRTLAGSADHSFSVSNVVDISTDCSKINDCLYSETENDLKEQSVTKYSYENVKCSFPKVIKDTNFHESQAEVSINTLGDTRYQDHSNYASNVIEISTDCSKTVDLLHSQIENDLKKERVTKSFDENVKYTIGNVSENVDFDDSQVESDVDISETNNHGCKLEESATKLKKRMKKYVKQENSFSSSDNSILEDHNYSKVYPDLEIIEVSSSEEEEEEEEDVNEDATNNTASKSDASCGSMKRNSSNEDVSKCKNANSSATIVQNAELSSKSDASFSSVKPSSSDKDQVLEREHSNNSSKIDDQLSTTKHPDFDCASANNSDSEVDFSEFIASNEEHALDNKVQHEIINETINPATPRKDLPVTVTVEQPEIKTFKKPLFLKPGKLWRRSLLTVRKSFIIHDPIVCISDNGCICACAKCRQRDSSTPSRSSRRMSIKVIPESPYCSLQNSTSFTINTTYGSNTIHDSVYREKSIGEPLLVRTSSIHESPPVISPSVTAREIVLRRCGQAEPISFTECYPSSVLKNCFKIGEGVYGEVFLFKHPDGGSRVMKVIPIEGDQMVNGEHQKKFEEIISEIVIALELSNLRNDKKNRTEGFSKVEKIRCVRGRYPDRLLELWELFDEGRGSENDSPEMFKGDQLYIVLELANGGQDMEAFLFNNALQAYALFKQTACALAVAESALQFEHRDLHWGNVLISQTDRNKKLTYCLNGQEFEVPACGIEVSIIDFTLSRVTCNGVCMFNDLGSDPELFTATGDYQFEVYKLMQKRNNDDWQKFEPYSNVLWLHYILDKMISALRYKNTSTNVHKEGILKIKQLKNRILKYSSVEDVVNNEFLL